MKTCQNLWFKRRITHTRAGWSFPEHFEQKGITRLKLAASAIVHTPMARAEPVIRDPLPPPKPRWLYKNREGKEIYR